MAAVAAADGLAALELHVTVAVAAGVGDGARVDVDGGGVGLGGLLGGLVAGHFFFSVCEGCEGSFVSVRWFWEW